MYAATRAVSAMPQDDAGITAKTPAPTAHPTAARGAGA
jgi:hypothetical protein